MFIYKSIRGNKFRTYIINVIPAVTCLPVSEWTTSNYKSYEELGGSGDDVEEGWSEGRSRRGEAARRREEDAGIKEPDDGVVNRPDYAGRGSRVHEPMENAEGRGVQLEEQLGEGLMDIQGGNELQDKDKEAKLKEEEERRRKGKGIMFDDMGGPQLGPGTDRRGRSPIVSGSGSCDPEVAGAQLGPEQLASEEADSKAGPTFNLGEVRDKPIVISEGSQEDYDMGGDGVKGAKVGIEIKQEEGATEGGRMRGIGDHQGGAQQAARRTGGSQKKHGSTEGSKGSVGSVPPGFTRRSRSQAGAASPFGKMQRGGFKFLKRSAAAASTGPKQASPAPSKKTRPIGEMQDKEIEEVAGNVGVKDQLSKEQIEHLKALERERASS